MPDYSEFPPGSRNDIANSIRPILLGYGFFLQKWFSGFWKKVSPGLAELGKKFPPDL